MNDLDEIRRVKAQAEPELLNLPGVTGVDIGYKMVNGNVTDVLAIRVYVATKRDVPQQEAVPKQIQGIPTDVIQRRFVLHGKSPNVKERETRCENTE